MTTTTLESLAETLGVSIEQVLADAKYLGNSYHAGALALHQAMRKDTFGSGWDRSPFSTANESCDRKIGHKSFYDKEGDTYELPLTEYERRAIRSRDILVNGVFLCTQKCCWVSGSWSPVAPVS